MTQKVNAGNRDSRENGGEGDKVVDRLNYGVLFQYEQMSGSVNDEWRHIFEIRLPYQPFHDENDYLTTLGLGIESPARNYCSVRGGGTYYSNRTGINNCRRFERQLTFLLDFARANFLHLHKLSEDIFDLIPEVNSRPRGTRNRVKKSWAPWVGNILATVGGVALESELIDMQKNILVLSDYMNKGFNRT
jgi:hypothetical protein